MFSSPASSLRGIRLRAAIGASVFWLTQIPMLLLQPDRGDGISDPGWFLNSGTNVLTIAVAVAIGAAVLSSLTSPTFASALSYIVGACFAMAVVLVAIGPGNLFPIVLVMGGAVITAVVAVVYGCVNGVRGLRRNPGSSH